MVTGARNVISGNGDDGMDLYGSNSLIIGNFIGTNASGTAALPNRCDGIYAFLATGNQIGGGLPGTGNVISGNGAPGGCDGYAYGLELVNVVNTGVFGNKIGTSASGTTALGNLGGGIALEGNAHGTSIGAPRASNVISGNKDDGIDIFGSAYDNAVVDNLVGTNAAGTGPLGNANFGVYVNSNGSGNSIGDPSDTNVIAFNGATTQAEGVRIDGATGVTISGNSIFSNGGLGIALVNNGNHYQPAPVITGVAPTPGGTNVSGTFSDSSEPNEFITIQLFANAKCDPSTYGEGQKLIASFTEETDASGNISWADKVTPALSSSMKIVTATATRVSNGDTSRFSGCKS
jgi:parallel beta-helix repeat protein